MRFADFQRVELADALHDALTAELDANLHEVCSQLARCVLAALSAAGALKHLSRQELATCAVRIVYQFLHSHGGHAYYFPMGGGLTRSSRDRQLVSKFKGNNIKELAREFGLSDMRVRQILSKHFPTERRGRTEVSPARPASPTDRKRSPNEGSAK